MDRIVQEVRRRDTDGIRGVSGKVSGKYRLAESKRVDHVFRIGSTGRIRAHCLSSPKSFKLPEQSVFLKVSGDRKGSTGESECIIQGWTNDEFGGI